MWFKKKKKEKSNRLRKFFSVGCVYILTKKESKFISYLLKLSETD